MSRTYSEEPVEAGESFLTSTNKTTATHGGVRQLQHVERQFTYSEEPATQNLSATRNVEISTTADRRFTYNENDPDLIHQRPPLPDDSYVKPIHNKRPPLPTPVVINPAYPTSVLPEETKDPKKTFNVDEVLSIVQEVTDSVLQDSGYLHTRASMWNTQIVNNCVKKLCELGKAFKYIVTCTIVQKTDAGLHSTSSCYWDARHDDFVKGAALKMSGAIGYIGSKISLISRSDIRYVGILHTINQADSTVALEQGYETINVTDSHHNRFAFKLPWSYRNANKYHSLLILQTIVRSFGTEGRRGNPSEEIPPSDNIFEYIVFRGSDVKDLHVCEAPAPQASLPPQVPNDPAILGTTAPRPPNFQGFGPPPPLGVQPPNFPTAQLNQYYLNHVAAAAAFQQQHQQHFWQQPQVPQQPQLNLPETTTKEAEQPKSQQQKEHSGPDKPEDHKSDNNQAALNKNLASKPGPSTRPAVGHSVNSRNDVIKDTSSNVVVEKLTKKVSELSVTAAATTTTVAKETNGDRQPTQSYERMGGHLVQPNRRVRGNRRNYSQSYDRNRIPVPASDFDFESSNAKFNKDEIVKEVRKTVPNHDGIAKEEEAIDTHPTTEDEDEEEILIPPSELFYDKNKSFFDNISCETKERLEQQGPDGRRSLSVSERRQKQSEERRLNLETFGQVSIDGGRYRGGYRSRGYRGGRGGYRGNRGGGSSSGGGGSNGGYRAGYSSSFLVFS
ncbi:8779_t:CDS:10 [Ambispora leptoticha]|uniref:8779_t:CDS:1 n=1 Tax=Ambispora leptoticha TaxID=144679 RepID=A0A9N9G0S3_9GLOM|nr:8779_t:CDS:10 [Ambispora leptoticha]